MKAFVKSWIAVFFTLTICVFGSMNAYAWNSRDDVFILEYKNAPEGTVFADILFKKIEDDKYAAPNEGKPGWKGAAYDRLRMTGYRYTGLATDE